MRSVADALGGWALADWAMGGIPRSVPPPRLRRSSSSPGPIGRPSGIRALRSAHLVVPRRRRDGSATPARWSARSAARCAAAASTRHPPDGGYRPDDFRFDRRSANASPNVHMIACFRDSGTLLPDEPTRTGQLRQCGAVPRVTLVQRHCAQEGGGPTSRIPGIVHVGTVCVWRSTDAPSSIQCVPDRGKPAGRLLYDRPGSVRLSASPSLSCPAASHRRVTAERVLTIAHRSSTWWEFTFLWIWNIADLCDRPPPLCRSRPVMQVEEVGPAMPASGVGDTSAVRGCSSLTLP